VEVPPGRHFIDIRCVPPPLYVPHDHKPMYYYIKDFVVLEPGVDAVPGPQGVNRWIPVRD
jgi:hypothetical protein